MSCCIDDGQIRCWGPQTSGACDVTRYAVEPVPVATDGAAPWTDVLTNGGASACGLDRDRTLICWGRIAGEERQRPTTECFE